MKELREERGEGSSIPHLFSGQFLSNIGGSPQTSSTDERRLVTGNSGKQNTARESLVIHGEIFF
jgi:hypothetical protein